MLAYNGNPDLKKSIVDQLIVVLKKSNQLSVNTVLGFSPILQTKRTILLPNIYQKRKCSQLFIQNMTYLPHDTIQNEKNSIFLPYIFLYSIFPSSNFHLYTNLSIFYSRNPRTPENHSVATE